MTLSKLSEELVSKVASGKMTWLKLHERRILLNTDRLCELTPWMKMAALRGRDQIRRTPLDRVQLLGLQVNNRREQALRVRVQRLVKHLFNGAYFDNPSGIQNSAPAPDF